MIESAEFQKLYALYKKLQIDQEMMALEFQLVKKKLKANKGIDRDETESNKNTSPFLGPNGNPLLD